MLIRLALAFILAGAIGNLIDRTFYGLIYHYAPLFFGRVVDFVQVDVWDFTLFGKTYTTWPIFNVADVSVTVGFMIILIFHKRIFKHKEETPEDITPDSEELHSPQFSSTENILSENHISMAGTDSVVNSAQNNLQNIEDSKEHSDISPSRSEEAADR